MSNIGFIGLGIMGRPMAAHLQAAGHKLFLYDIGALPQDMLAAGAVACTSGKDVASQAEIVILMVPDTPHVEAALFSANGVAEGLSAGKIVIDMSSISPIATKEFAAKINALGCDYLDAPVSGGEVGAKEASAALTRRSRRFARCSRRWARTSLWSVAPAMARPPRSPTRSSWP